VTYTAAQVADIAKTLHIKQTSSPEGSDAYTCWYARVLIAYEYSIDLGEVEGSDNDRVGPLTNLLNEAIAEANRYAT
jgi:hypothetical protein